MVKTQFSIKDLENLSGVKAHTIRIWEKRYNLLHPLRTDTNIRQYDIEGLKKLLNVTALYNQGYKISKIASLTSQELNEEIGKDLVENQQNISIQKFKTAMFDFDHSLFSEVYQNLIQKHSFSDIFENIFIPFLNELGQLWLSGTIDPAHERFISELIKQKLVLNIDEAQNSFKQQKKSIFSLFLPYGEIHEIGLLYAYYLLLNNGCRAIYLGSNIPLSSLEHVLRHHSNVIFLTYSTVEPQSEDLEAYFNDFLDNICSGKDCQLWVLGQRANDPIVKDFSSHIIPIRHLQEFKKAIEASK